MRRSTKVMAEAIQKTERITRPAMTTQLVLDDICELIVDCEHKTAPITAEGYPSIRTPNIGRGHFILDHVNRVSEETYTQWTKRAVPLPGDLIMAREAPVGNVAMIPTGLQPCLGQRTLLIRPKKTKVDSRYLTYLLIGDEVQGRIHGMTGGATVAHLNMKDVRSLTLPPIPPLPTQRKIAAILSAYDDLIENNFRRIKILEDMARSLYREWFVNFRFPGHRKVRMANSPLGKIPEGWKVAPLSLVAAVNQLQVNSRSAPSRIRYIDIASVSPGRVDSITEYNFADAPGRARRVVRHGDILWSCVRPNRRSYVLLIQPDETTIASTGFAVLTATEVPFSYLYQATTTDEFVSYLTNHATGAAYPAVTASTFESADVILPPDALLQKFAVKADPLALSIDNLQRRNQNLRSTRDLLIPKLISGELDISDFGIVIRELSA